ncbi:MAG TPA: FkbM family methyltransferase, partial [Solirubrobacteraceae bacterium]|nr:FkbM family methyltransferase [Solirubrobacteraceae bacterium]
RRAEARGDDSLSRPALHGIDRALDRIIDRDGGFYVEAGANDGYAQSNTYWLARFRGWRGVLVEPIPELFAEVVRERPEAHAFNCALVPFGHPGETVEMRYGGLMSVVAGARGSEADDRAYVGTAFLLGIEEERDVVVPARTLSSILDELGAPEVDLLSLDVEGFEPSVLEGLDLERHAPRFVLVEVHDVSGGRERIEAILGERYEPLGPLSPGDVLYRRR